MEDRRNGGGRKKMKKVIMFKLNKAGYVYIVADTISAVRVFGECVRIYTIGNTFFDVEDSLERVSEIIKRAI